MLVAATAVISCCGCRLAANSQQSLTTLYDRGDVSAALERLDELSKRRDADEQILEMEGAVLQLLAGRPQDTVRCLETVRRDLEYFEQTEVTEEARAVLQDERVRAWSGRDYERRMLDNLQILASLLAEDGDATALATRGMQAVYADDRTPFATDETAEELPVGESTPESAVAGRLPQLSSNRMTAWLAAAVHSERMQDARLTDRLIQHVSGWTAGDGRDVNRVQQLGTRADRGHGTLQIVTFAGRVTPWESERAEVTSGALLLADRILSGVGDHTLPPTMAAVRIARPAMPACVSPYRTRVMTESGQAANGVILLDLNQVAWASYQSQRDQQIARAVARRIVKKGAVYSTKNSLDVHRGSGTDLLLNAAGVLWESLERADLRHWQLLPASVEVTQLQLPAGQHEVTLQVVAEQAGGGSPPVDQLQLPVRIEDGNNTFVVCFRPLSKLHGVQCR